MFLGPRFAVLVLAFAAQLMGAAAAYAWSEIHPGVAKEASECVSWSPGRIDCFARTPSGSLTWVFLENGSWSAPHDLGGKLASAPSCVVRGPGGINCFAASAKGVLATIYLNGKTWSKWSSLGGDLRPARAACVALARDRIVCFARGRNDQLMSRKWSGGKTWEDWRNLGGALSADPECVLVGASGAACFGRGAAGELVGFLPDAAGKSGGWTLLGGRIEGKPSCVRLRSGEVTCLAQSQSGHVHVWQGMPLFGQDAGVTSAIDDAVVAAPACALQNGALVCFMRTKREVVRRTIGIAADASHDGVVKAPQPVGLACIALGDGVGCALTDGDRKLHFALNQGLDASAPPAPKVVLTAADEGAEGLWFFANPATGGVCRVVLLPEFTLGAKRLRFGRRCRVTGLITRPALWNQVGRDLQFLAADGRVLAQFRSPQSGRWVSPRQDAPFQLTREPPSSESAAEADDMSIAEMFGPWRVFAGDREPLCTISLTNARLGDGYVLRLPPDCASRLANVRSWSEDDAALVLFGAGNVVVARFDSAGPGEWRSQALGGLTLKR